jgi:hypothetical protein
LADVRLFTVAEAERALPLVRRILADLSSEYPLWRQAVSSYELLAGAARSDWGETPELIAARDQVGQRAERISGWLAELEQIGCLFKGFDPPLVDFYSLRDDRLIFLCWHPDDHHISHWHEVDEGFAGRHPLEAGTLGHTAS